MHYNEECDKEPACRRVEGRAGQRTTAAEEREDGRREGGREQKLDGTEGRMGQWKWWAAQIPVCNLPHRGISNSAKSGLKTRAFINFRFSQDVKEVMR